MENFLMLSIGFFFIATASVIALFVGVVLFQDIMDWRKKEMIKNFLKTLLAVLWCLADPKKATAAANEAATVEEFDHAMMKEMGDFL